MPRHTDTTSPQPISYFYICLCDGIGRHPRLRIWYPQGCASSSLARGTIRGIRKIKNVERRATDPVRWPPRQRVVGGSRQMRISCNPLFPLAPRETEVQILPSAEQFRQVQNALGSYALVMELVDFLDSESKVRKGVRVQVPPRAPQYNIRQLTPGQPIKN